MAAVPALTSFLDIEFSKLSKHEMLILEAELFIRVIEEIKEQLRIRNKIYLRLLKLDKTQENAMIEASVIRCLINDILSSDEYNLPGIAYYTDTPEEIIFEVASGNNNSPSLLLAKKVIELHRSIRPNLYREIINKVLEKDEFTNNFISSEE